VRRSRVLVIGLNYAPEHTGIAPYTTAMARGIARDHDVQVVTAHPHYPDWQIFDGYGGWRRHERDSAADVLRLRHYVPQNPVGTTRILSEATFAARALASRARRADLVVTVSPALLPVFSARALAALWQAPLGIVVQDLYSRALEEVGMLGKRSSGAATLLESALLRSASGIVAIHDRFADTMTTRLHVDPHRITVIPNWTHVPPPSGDRLAVRRRMGWGGETVVLHAGNMGAKQGLDSVVRAAAMQDNLSGITDSPRIRFVLMGNGNQRAALERQAAGLGSIDVINGVPDADFSDVLSAADVLLLHEKPGLVEMCVPSKLTSYFAAGRPVLAATDPRSAAAAEIGASGAGRLVPPGDPAALLAALDQLTSDKATDQMGPNGQAYAREHLTEESALTAYRDWVSRLLAGKSSVAKR
jgi:glycosyltransferase involved in cell wall biosynthesis